MEQYMFNGIILPAKIVEGAISIKDTVSVTGADKKPTLSNQARVGKELAIVGHDGEYPLVELADGTNGVVIGFLHDNPEYDMDPIKDYTKAQAISAGMLRKCGVETTFVDIRTVDAKASESITPGMYVEWSADGWKKTASSGTTKSDALALSTQGTDNRIIIGLK